MFWFKSCCCLKYWQYCCSRDNKARVMQRCLCLGVAYMRGYVVCTEFHGIMNVSLIFCSIDTVRIRTALPYCWLRHHGTRPSPHSRGRVMCHLHSGLASRGSDKAQGDFRAEIHHLAKKNENKILLVSMWEWLALCQKMTMRQCRCFSPVQSTPKARLSD